MKKCFTFSFFLENIPKLDLKMRLTIILLTVVMFNAFANGYSQKMTLNLQDVELNSAFNHIENNSEYRFLYQESEINTNLRISLNVRSAKIEKILTELFRDTPIRFQVLDKQIILGLKNRFKSLSQNTMLVEGVVSDGSGPLPGITIIYKEYPNKGTATDINGKYQILVNKDQKATLQFSGVGYKTQEIDVNGRTTINVTMEEEFNALDEVVVIGYGTQKRSEVSSAVSSVKADKLVNNLGTNTSFDRGLSGVIKGVQITQTSGQPGSGVDINIRGITSPFGDGNNNPLFVIDGVPFQTNPAYTFTSDLGFNTVPNPLQALNPNEIESIDVLKDASATAIYGSRGANGVIIVNTKKGKKNQKTNISFSATSTFGKPINTPEYLNTQQYKDRAAHMLENSAAFANASPALSVFVVSRYNYMADVPVNFGVFPFTVSYNGLRDSWFGTANTNWADLVYRDPAFTQQYNLAVNGGSEKTAYGISLGHTNQEGLVREEEFKQYNFRANLETQISKAITAGFNANLSYSDNQAGYNGGDFLNTRTLTARPDIVPYDEFGNFNRLPGRIFGSFDTQAANPLALATGHNNNTKSFSILGNVFLEVEPIKNLKIRSDVNIGRFRSDVNNFSPATKIGSITPVFGALATAAESNLTTNSTINTNLIANLTANYSTTFAEKHTINAMLGFAWDRNYADRSYFFYTGFPDDNTLTTSTSALQISTKSRNEIETGLNSIFSRISYNYDEKYFLTFNFRTDRSIKFGPENQRGYFPSVAASWNIAKESFLENSDVVDNLRLRVGYGRSGQNNIGDFAYLQFWAVGARDAGLYNGNLAVGLNGNLPNLDVKWENTDELNLGLDFAFLNNRLRGSFDIYNRKTTDALMNGQYLLESGAERYIQNFADLTNKGFEVDLFGDIIRNENLTWTLGVNLAKNKNTLDKFNASGINPFIRRFYEIGREVNIIRGYVTNGYFQTQAELDALNTSAPDGVYQEAGTAPGDYKYVDLNGDGEITTEDQQYLGSAQPDLFGGFNTAISYKGFQLSANFSYSIGGEAEITADRSVIAGDPTVNVQTRYLDTWRPDNPNAAFPRSILNDTFLNRNSRTSSALVYDTSHLRLQSLQLRYHLPDNVIESLGLSRVALSVTGTNLFTVTDFPGLDPGAIGGLSSTGSTSTNSPYPLAKTWSFGINVNF